MMELQRINLIRLKRAQQVLRQGRSWKMGERLEEGPTLDSKGVEGEAAPKKRRYVVTEQNDGLNRRNENGLGVEEKTPGGCNSSAR
jgi:hypothetical protein